MGFPINFPQITGKHNKTYGMGKVWEIDTHTFPIPMVLFPIRFPSCGILKHMGNAHGSCPCDGFPHKFLVPNFPQCGKI